MTGHERQDDDGRADRPHPPRGRPAGRRRRQRRHARSASLVGALAPGRDRRLRGLLVPARGHDRVRARAARAAEPRARPPRPPRRHSTPTATRSCASSPPGQRRRRGRAGRRSASRTSAAARGASLRRAAGADLPSAPAQLWWRGEPLLRVGELRLRGAHNRATRWPPRRSASRAGSTRRGPRRPARLRRRRAPPRGGRRVDGVLYVNDSKATNVDTTLVALRASPDARPPDRSAGGARRRTSRRCAPPSPALRERLPDRRGRGGDRAPRSRARRAADAARRSSARSPARAAPPGPARSCCSRRPARASTSSLDFESSAAARRISRALRRGRCRARAAAAEEARAAPRSSTRMLLDRDAVPARVRRA